MYSFVCEEREERPVESVVGRTEGTSRAIGGRCSGPALGLAVPLPCPIPTVLINFVCQFQTFRVFSMTIESDEEISYESSWFDV
ncbi:hypothetical protein HanIR_Chr10g0470611 [Helianthus annuus]|nr:hypothetical protein HanIR_Chr10g0470611 [Helianthus annuus]